MGLKLSDYDPAVKYGAEVDAKTDITVVDDLTVSDDLTVTGLATIGETLAVTGVATFTVSPVYSAGVAFANGTVTPMISVPDGAAYTVLAANSGKLHLILNQAQDATLTLPTAAAGLHYKFISTMEAADGHDWIFDTGADANFYKGGLLFIDSDIAGSSSEVILSAGDGDSNSKLQINLPSVSTVIEMYCDGTNWFINGTVFSTTAPAFSDQ